MKTEKLVDKVKAFLGAGDRSQQKKYKSLKKVLEKLGKKEAGLKKKLSAEDDKGRRRKLRRQLKVIAAQLAKGTKLLAQIEKKRKG